MAGIANGTGTGSRTARGRAGAGGRRPVIGIVMTQVPGETIQRISCHYLHSVVDAGGLPVLVPVLEEPDVTAALLAQVDGVLMTGGQDIVPATYGDALSSDPTVAGTVDSTPARDLVEAAHQHRARN